MSKSSNQARTLPRVFQFAVFSLASLAQLVAQQPSINSTSPVIAATFGQARPHQVTMNGVITVYGGAKPEQGTVKLVAKDYGESHVFITLASGERDEEQWDATSQRSCRIVAKGKEDLRVTPNCWRSSSWFFPQMALLDNTQKLIETRDLGESLDGDVRSHGLETSRVLKETGKNAEYALQIKTWSKTTLDLTPETLLPSSLTYYLFGDRNIQTKIAVKVTFSSYQPIDGIQIPHHIQRYLNNALEADILISSVEVK